MPKLTAFVIDEIHQIASYHSIGLTACKYVSNFSTFKFGLTATPVSSSMDDLKAIVEALNAKSIIDSEMFASRAKARSSLSKELVKRLHSELIDRRTASDLKNSLPETKVLYVEFDAFVGHNEKKTKKLSKKLQEKTIRWYNRALRTLKQLKSTSKKRKLKSLSYLMPMNHMTFCAPLARMSVEKFLDASDPVAVRRREEVAKNPSQQVILLNRIVKDRQDRGFTHVIVFSVSRVACVIGQEAFRVFGTTGSNQILVGTQTQSERNASIESFESAEKGVLFLSKAGGTGIDLSAKSCTMVIWADFGFSASALVQAYGRIRRISQLQPAVELIHLIPKHGMGAAKLRFLKDKIDRLSAAVTDQDFTKFSQVSTDSSDKELLWRYSSSVIQESSFLDDNGNFLDLAVATRSDGTHQASPSRHERAATASTSTSTSTSTAAATAAATAAVVKPSKMPIPEPAFLPTVMATTAMATTAMATTPMANRNGKRKRN